MNLVGKWGDDAAHVEENKRLLAAAAGFDATRLLVAKQVHGRAVYEISNTDTPATVAEQEVDALVSRVPGVTLAISAADCTPILLAGPKVVAAAHAGWRGTVAGVAVAALRAMAVPKAQVRAAIGPCICVRCFEVGEDVAAHFDAAHVRRDLGPKPHVDLQAANAAALRAEGVSVDIVGACTLHEPERFFSFRRHGGKGGGHLSFIGLGA